MTGWTSLDWAKLVTSGLVPLAVAATGFFISTRLARQTSQQLVAKRVAVFDAVAPDYNRLLCYLLYWNDWKQCAPAAVIELKRRVDRQVFVYAWIFEGDVLGAHEDFMRECFRINRGPGTDAGIRSESAPRAAADDGWNPSWNGLFTGERSHDRQPQIVAAYERAMAALSAELKDDARRRPFVSAKAPATRG